MYETNESTEGRAEADVYQEMASLIEKSPCRWQSACAVLGVAGSVVAPLLGATSGALTWFVNATAVNSYLHVLSVVFCALTLPLLGLGAYCLDALETKNAQPSPPPHACASS